jgi:predicted phosphodiesterase
MRKFLRRILFKPVLRISNRFSANPDKERVFEALSKLYDCIVKGEKSKGVVIPFDITTGKFIIFSDQHKGGGNGADDFLSCEKNYNTALDYYYQNGFHFISLGDSEELWENLLGAVKKNHAASIEKEKQFIPKNAFIKIFGNHDLFWDNDPFAPLQIKDMYGKDIPVHEGVVLETDLEGHRVQIFCTHGHQGDKVSDGNLFSKFFISRIWAPLQMFLRINPNTPAYDANLKTLHNTIMFEWSAQQNEMLLITGHTHQPVFESLTHIERLYRQLLFARQQKDEKMIKGLETEIQKRKFGYAEIPEMYLHVKPTYFNSGCCCFSDGDITGIEIADGCLRLVEWSEKDGRSERMILEESSLAELFKNLREVKAER